MTGSPSRLTETRKGSEGDLLEIGQKTIVSATVTAAMTEITTDSVVVTGETGDGEARRGTDTETWRTETGGPVAIETEREIQEIGSLAETRKKAEERKKQR